jgi:chorismate dehydratase
MKPDSDEPSPKLRMAPKESTEELSQRFEREQRITLGHQEEELSKSLAPFRVGSVRYLNAVPLTRGLEDQVIFATPSELAGMLRKNQLDAALVSVTEVLFHENYDILDAIAVASLNEVRSVFLAHRRPLKEVDVIHCDPASLTSVTLLKVLLAEKGLHPKFTPLACYDCGTLPDFTLLIGDPAITFLRSKHQHQIWDLGQAWHELTNLPFVFAVWALRRGLDSKDLIFRLREAKHFGLDTLDHIIQERTDFDLEFRKDYLTWHIHYHLGEDERKGLARFIELIGKHDLGKVYLPRFVS